jgi:hypothetical protein
MTITGFHVLQTYNCFFGCDYYFVYSNPNAKGIIKISDINKILKEAKTSGILGDTLKTDEPFLYYQVMLGQISIAIKHGFKVGIFT